MLKYIFLQLIVKLAVALHCDLDIQVFYNGACIDKACLYNKLAKFEMIQQSESLDTQQPTLNTGIKYNIEPLSNKEGYYYKVTLNYPDLKNDQILGERSTCLDFGIYSTKNSFAINPARQFLIANDGQTWPKSIYSYNEKTGYASITFNIRQKEMESYCIKLPDFDNVKFVCNFELAFLISGVTQVSYYFSINAIIYTSISNSQLPPATFEKLIQYHFCFQQEAEIDLSLSVGNPNTHNAQPRSECLVNVDIDSVLLFCNNSDCVKTADKPFTALFLNQKFFMKHRISDAAFQSWYILFPQINYQSQQLTIQLDTNELSVKKYEGYNIYELSVPIVTTDVLISASGTLEQNNQLRRLANEEKQRKVVYDSQYTGEVQVVPTASQSDKSVTNSASQYIVSCLLSYFLILVLTLNQ